MSRASDGVVKYGKWLPDIPELDNPGLTEALNVLPVARSYVPYRPLSTQEGPLASRPYGAISVVDSDANTILYAGTATDLYQRSVATWTNKSTAATYTLSTLDYWRFVQFDDFVVATSFSDVPQKLTIGDAGDFDDLADTGTAPNARQVGVIGRFVVLGDIDDPIDGRMPSAIQWSAIDDATDWPTPDTADARTKQSGRQIQNGAGGPITGIEGDEQFGIIFQRSRIARATYVGGDIVFQFDNIDTSRGCICPNGIATIGKRRYFIASDGFYVTDGVNVEPIGDGQVDQWFLENWDQTYPERVCTAVDLTRKIIYWAFPASGNTGGQPNALIIYNYVEQRWTHAEQVAELIISGLSLSTSIDDFDDLFASVDDIEPPLDSAFWAGGAAAVFGWDEDFQVGTLAGDPGTATLDGQEAELNPGLYTYVEGIKPLVHGNGSTVDVTIALGQRNATDETVTYSSAVDRTSTTGYCDFDTEARYNRARMVIEGDFKQALGVHFQQQAAGT